MVRPTYIILHRTEWDRIQRQSGPPEVPKDLKSEYLKALTEESQSWIKTWPDTVAGHVAQLKKQKKNQRRDNIAFIKAFNSVKKEDKTAEVIKNARQMIFDRSCYGRKLWGALIGSSIYEERLAQIKFKKELQHKAAKLAEEERASKNFGYLIFDDKEEEKKKIAKLTAITCNRHNKEMLLKKTEKELLMKQEEKQCLEEVEQIIKNITLNEKKIQEKIKRKDKESMKEYEAERIESEKRRVREKELEHALTEVYRKGQEKVKYKVQLQNKINNNRLETQRYKDHYEVIKQMHNEERKLYEDFVESGVKRYEGGNLRKEEKDVENEKHKRSIRCAISKRNQIVGEEERLTRNLSCANKCACERQTLIMKRQKSPIKKTQVHGKDKTNKLSFLEPRNILLEEQKKREIAPLPWTGAETAHEQFAQNASAILEECKHKKLVYKVIDEYRKFNGLDKTTLPIPKY